MRRLVSGSACLCLAFGCQAFVGEYSADRDDGAVSSSAELCAVDATLTFDLDLDSDEAKDSLQAYYDAANPALIDNLADVVAKFESGEQHGGVTYLRGAAGVGKSFVMTTITGGFADSDQCYVEFADLFAASTEDRGFDVELRADLATTNGAHVFNELPSISRPADFDMETVLEAIGCADDGAPRPLIVLDGIDEIHDDAARLILERIDDYILQRDKTAIPFVHFLISGRPEGFATWLTASERHQENTDIERNFDLQGPKYVTAGDLTFRVRAYLEFIFGDDFTDEDVAEYSVGFFDALTRHPFLRYTTSNLAFGNFVIDQTALELGTSERTLKARLFDDILERDVDTHGRPGADSEFDAAYRHALEDIAARYVDVDSQGRFSVSPDDTVECFGEDGDSLGRLRVRDVLNRSGMAFLSDPRRTSTRYRFDPFWVHGHLLERRNERLNPGYAYQGCEP